jgi:TonB family protein
MRAWLSESGRPVRDEFVTSGRGGRNVRAAIGKVVWVVASAAAVVFAGDEAPRQWQGALDLRKAVRIKSEHVAVDRRELEAAGVDPAAFTPPKRVKGSPAVYPESAARAGAQGLVRLECLIKDSGKVEACRITQTVRPAIDQAAAEAIRHWKYDPARVKEEPTSIVAEFVMIFSLR